MSETTSPRIILLMGVSGSGKTRVGRELAESLGWDFYDGDDLHPEENVAKMGRGQPLTDEDRAPWLIAVRDLIIGLLDSGSSAVVACSALKKSYRRLLRTKGAEFELVYLRGSRELISRRLAGREGHFMPRDLLDSQFEDLEEPECGLAVDIDDPPASIVATIVEWIRSR